MSYKVSAIITPFCRNLLAPASVSAFFAISDVGLGPKLQEACKNRHGRKPLVPFGHRQPEEGRTVRDFFDDRKWSNGATDDQRLLYKNTSCCSIVFVKGKEQWHISSYQIAIRLLTFATTDPRADSM